MDPLTIALIAAGAAVAGSGGVGAWLSSRRQRLAREAMARAVRTTIPCGAQAPVSLLDLFWDLGSSDFALEVLAHRDLLLDTPEQLPALMTELPARIAEAGSYRALVDEILEAIEEFQRQSAGNRRAIPALAAPTVKALPAAGETGALAVTQTTAASRDWEAWRTGRTSGALGDAAGQNVDVDQVLDAGVGSMLSSLFEGNISQEFRRWSAQREAKKVRVELDRALESLHAVYANHVAHDPRTLELLHDASRRWDAERNRIEVLRSAAPYRERSWAMCADTLLEASAMLALQMSQAAQANVSETLARIEALAGEGNRAMAGYLVYVNRYALFVGRMQLCEAQVRAIEGASDRLRAKLGELRRKGLG